MEPIRPHQSTKACLNTKNKQGFVNFGSNINQYDSFESRTQQPRRGLLGRIADFVQITFGRNEAKKETPKNSDEAPCSIDLNHIIQNAPTDTEKVCSWTSSKMAKFLDSPDYEEKIKEATQGKYQKELFEVLKKENLSAYAKAELIESGLSEEEFLSALRKLSKSTFKAALNKPEQYINYTQDRMFQDFQMAAFVIDKRYSSDEEEAGAYMTQFFGEHIAKLAKALQYVDTDTLNQMMDKRSTGFLLRLNAINSITPKNGELLKELIGKTREGDAKQKIKLCELVEIFQTNDFDMNILKELAKDEIVDTSKISDVFKNAIAKKTGLEGRENIRTEFNQEYIHLLFSMRPVMSRGVRAFKEEEDFNNLFREAAKGNFEDYINDEGNKYGRANKNTKEIFEGLELNYDKWVHPDIEEMKFSASGKEMKLKLWERNPYEDLFLGNKTRCCTAIATGSNGASMPIFLMNTSFNVIELFDEKNNVKGMARIYMSDVDGETSVVVDSIELTDIKQMDDEDKIKIAKNIFDYTEKFAQTITGKETKIYYIEEDAKIPLGKFTISKLRQAQFIGDVSNNSVYSNNSSSSKWEDIREKGYIALIDALKYDA